MNLAFWRDYKLSSSEYKSDKLLDLTPLKSGYMLSSIRHEFGELRD